MRIFALGFTALAFTVWWSPMPKLAQSLTLVLLAVTCLAYRSAQRRLDKANRLVMEAKEILRQVREGGQQ